MLGAREILENMLHPSCCTPLLSWERLLTLYLVNPNADADANPNRTRRSKGGGGGFAGGSYYMLHP